MLKSVFSVSLMTIFCLFVPFMTNKVYVNKKAAKAQFGEAGDTLNHEQWGKILSTRVDEKGLFDYEGLKKDKEDLKNLAGYLDYLGKVNPDKLKSQEEKLVFWINCYNAAAVAGVMKFYPIESVKDIDKFWHRVIVNVGDKEYSLGDIENSVLRQMEEPRFHWAIVRVSKGCAKLLAEPYDSKKIKEQLEKQEKEYLVGRKQVYLDREKSALYLSSIFFWYGEDFIKEAGTKIDYVRKYLSKEDLSYLEDNPVATRYIKYDWSLNAKEK